jgi:integrating conjugative element membrane protein (TIGR03747 family)
LAGKNNDKDGVKQTLWPVFKAIELVVISLLAPALSLVVMGFYLWRFAPPAEHQAHLDEMMAFYVDNAVASDRADAFGKGAYRFVLVETGLERVMQRRSLASSTGLQKNQTWNKISGLGVDLWDVVRKTSYIFGAKLSSLISVLPLMCLLALVALVDGWTARYIRREEGGNESATRYHLWKTVSHSWLPSLIAVVYLTCPIAVEPLWFILPTAIVLVVGLRSQTKYFKKYL